MLDFDQFYSASRQDPEQAYRNLRESRRRSHGSLLSNHTSRRSVKSEGQQSRTSMANREQDQMLENMVNLLIQKKSIKHFESEITGKNKYVN